MKSEVRDYQVNSKAMIRNEFKRGNKKVLLWLATGAGKTHIFCDMVKSAAAKGKKCLIVARGRKLIDQASQRLTREGVYHGVMMAGHWNYRPTMPVQVCSVDTLIARSISPPADLIIIDEAHLAASPGYIEWLKSYNTYIIAVTATPWVDKSLRHVADTIIHPITMMSLIERNYLVPFRYFAPQDPDLRSIKIVNKEYKNDQLEVAMSGNALTGKIIDHWKKLAQNRPTFLFAVNVNHSKMLVEKFCAAGIKAEHCEASTPDKERQKILDRIESGETQIVSNVGILCTGVDVPCIGAIIMARPIYSSKNLYIQQAGRGTRIFPGKKDCLLLDHSGNIHRHGFPTDEELVEEINLDGEPIKRVIIETKRCPVCFSSFRGADCPECGTKAPIAPKIEIKESDEELVEISSATIKKAFKNSVFKAVR